MSDIKSAVRDRWNEELASSMDRAEFEDWVSSEARRLEEMVARLLPDREAAEIRSWIQANGGTYPDFLTASALRSQAMRSVVESVLTNEVWEGYQSAATTPPPAGEEDHRSGMDRWLSENPYEATREMELLAEEIWPDKSVKFRVWGEQLLQARAVDGLSLPQSRLDAIEVAVLTSIVQAALDAQERRDAERVAGRRR